jgi:transcriptional regulator with GAF, ATPase, and Fis domain
MDVTLYLYTPICIEYILSYNLTIFPIILEEEVAELILRITKDIKFKIWDFENLDKTIDNIQKFLPNFFGTQLSSVIYAHTTRLSVLYHDTQISYKCINQQCLYLSYIYFVSYIIRILEIYCQLHNIKNITKEVFTDLFVNQLDDCEDFIIDEIDFSPLKIIIKYVLLNL